MLKPTHLLEHLDNTWSCQNLQCIPCNIVSVFYWYLLQWVVCLCLSLLIEWQLLFVVVEVQNCILSLTPSLLISLRRNLCIYDVLCICCYRCASSPYTDLLYLLYPFCSSWTSHAASWTHL